MLHLRPDPPIGSKEMWQAHFAAVSAEREQRAAEILNSMASEANDYFDRQDLIDQAVRGLRLYAWYSYTDPVIGRTFWIAPNVGAMVCSEFRRLQLAQQP